MDQEERIALFLDYENLAIGARDHLGGMTFDLRPVADALAERGRVVVRRAYADWSYFDEDRRMLTRSHVELIDIPQRMGASRKNAADIKMAVDALELAFERDYISTFVLVHRRQRLHPAGPQAARAQQARHRRRRREDHLGAAAARPATSSSTTTAWRASRSRRRAPGAAARRGPPEPEPQPVEPEPEPQPAADEPARDVDTLAALVAQTVAGLQRSSSGAVTASTLKRTLLRKDPTFNEADYGFRAFGELLRHLAEHNVVELVEGPAKGDPEVSLPEHGDREAAFALLRSVVFDLAGSDGAVALSGLKNQVRRVRPDFSEKKLGYRSFLQFCKAAATSGAVDLQWSADADDYLLTTAPPS